MKTFELRRVCTGSDGTAGVLKYKNFPICVTLEPEWADNRNASNGVQGSCIPAGTYICKRVKSPKYGNVFEITSVTNRSHILIHWGNNEYNSDGCLLLGEMFEPVNGRNAIQMSKVAFNQFMKILERDNECRLIIVDDYLTPLN